MSSVALASPIEHTPFCGTPFKGVRVFTPVLSKRLYALCQLVLCAVYCIFLSDSLYALSLLCLSTAFCVFNKKFSLRCFSVAEKKFSQGLNIIAFYFKFGGYLINDSYNGCTVPLIFPSDESSFKVALESHYGVKAINHWWGLVPDRPINLERRTKLLKEGVCFGMSLDFLTQYVWRVQEGLEPILAIRKVSARYAEGASKEAQLAQIFYETSLLSSKERNDYIDTVGLSDFIEGNFSLLISRISAMEARIHADSFQATGKKLGLRLERPMIYNYPETSMDYEDSLSRFLDFLPASPYLIGIRSLQSHHAVSLIKLSGGQHFFFDANVGTILWRKGEFSARFCQLLKHSNLKGRLCSLAFWPAAHDPLNSSTAFH